MARRKRAATRNQAAFHCSNDTFASVQYWVDNAYPMAAPIY